jgi:hypothetical protein
MNGARSRFTSADDSPKHVDPLEANASTEWVETMAKAGFTVAIVAIHDSPEALQKAAGSGFGEQIGEQLSAANMGHWDGARNGSGGLQMFFYLHTARLPAGLTFIRNQIEAAGLLSHCRIGYADQVERIWRVFHPEIPDNPCL